jgi:hypothetical protein
MCDGIELIRGYVTPEPGCLERDRSATGKQVNDLWWLTTVRREYFLSRCADR